MAAHVDIHPPGADHPVEIQRRQWLIGSIDRERVVIGGIATAIVTHFLPFVAETDPRPEYQFVADALVGAKGDP